MNDSPSHMSLKISRSIFPTAGSLTSSLALNLLWRFTHDAPLISQRILLVQLRRRCYLSAASRCKQHWPELSCEASSSSALFFCSDVCCPETAKKNTNDELTDRMSAEWTIRPFHSRRSSSQPRTLSVCHVSPGLCSSA